MASGWDIIDKPLQTAKKWQKILDSKDKQGVVDILSEIMSFAAACCKQSKITMKDYEGFFDKYNQLESFKVKCEDYDVKWSIADGINFLKNLCYDIIRLCNNEEFKGIVPNLIIFSGVFLWLQRGVAVEDIPDQVIGKNQEEAEESEEPGDSIDDELPYFGSSSKKEEKKARRKLVKRSKASKKQEPEEVEESGDEYEDNLNKMKSMLVMTIAQIKEQKLDENTASLFTMSSFLAILSYFGLAENYIKNYDKTIEMVEEIQKLGK